MTITLMSKTRTVDGQRVEGPVHVHYGGSQSWCGRRITGFSHYRPGTIDEATCQPCIRALAAGRPRAWRRH